MAKAIELGAELIKDKVKQIVKGDLHLPPGPGRSYDAGTLALCLLTLVKAGEKASDPTMKAGFDLLRKRIIKDTYSLATALMAFEALYAPGGERQALIEGRIKEPFPRKVPEEDLKLMEGWVKEILNHTDRRVRDPDNLRRFSYTKNPTVYDNSNSQYALLGLYSGKLCGVEIPTQVWVSCANHWLDDQYETKDTPPSLVLVSHLDYRKLRQEEARKKRRRRTVRARRVKPAGWPYLAPKPRRLAQGVETPRGQVLTGSMTSAGITALTICQAVLGQERKLKKERGKMQLAVRQGYSWMLNNFSVRKNKHGRSFHFYYLYGLERACELGQVALIGNRDWYFEGSIMLIGLQQRTGNFTGADLAANCFAVLFLKVAAPPLPVLTGKR